MLFPKWSNKVLPLLMLVATLFLVFTIFVFWFWFSPKNLEVGYSPKQPIAFSHKLHVGELGMDCRYCHYTVETSPHAAVPPTEVCMNCHTLVKTDSTEIRKLHYYHSNHLSIPWVNVHNLPEFSYFNHSRHIEAGVSCVSCHGRIDKMEQVYQSEPLSMGWCLECHRHPEAHLRPKEFITDLDWSPTNQLSIGKHLKHKNNIAPREDCNTCHR